MTLTLAIMNETGPLERRVAMVPETIARLLKKYPTFKVVVESDAGKAAGFPNAAYTAAGATVETTLAKVEADVLFRITPPNAKAKLPLKAQTGVLVTLGTGPASWDGMKALAPHVLALEKLPRTSRAQAMDVLSSQANLGGYAAVLAAANHLPRLMPMLMTAAGSAKPAQALVLGVGVAGLQAIATARRLGAQVSAFDVRPEVAEQIKSLGAKVVEVDGPTTEGKGGYAGALDEAGQKALRDKLATFVAAADVVISTAQVPGKPAPVLISEAAIAAMKPGSVVADLAAGGFNKANGIKGGNCPLTVADATTVTENGITLLGQTNWASTLAGDASRFWSQNMLNLLGIMVKDNVLDFADELVAAMELKVA
jgi:NAD(P) transhydrogenase subunit alpha